MNTSSVAHLTLAENSILTISNAIAGDFGTLKVIQGAGAYTLTLPTGSKKTATITISTTNGAIDISDSRGYNITIDGATLISNSKSSTKSRDSLGRCHRKGY